MTSIIARVNRCKSVCVRAYAGISYVRVCQAGHDDYEIIISGLMKMPRSSACVQVCVRGAIFMHFDYRFDCAACDLVRDITT